MESVHKTAVNNILIHHLFVTVMIKFFKLKLVFMDAHFVLIIVKEIVVIVLLVINF